LDLYSNIINYSYLLFKVLYLLNIYILVSIKDNMYINLQDNFPMRMQYIFHLLKLNN